MAAQKTNQSPAGSDNGRKVPWLGLAGLGVALAAFGLSALLAGHGRPTGWEVTWFMAINGLGEGWSRLFMFITLLGSLWAAALSVAGAYLVLYHLAWRLALSVLVTYGLVMAAKAVVGRDRPEAFLHEAAVRSQELSLGFPSGHSAFAAVIVLSILPYVPRRWWWLPLGVVGLVATSRIYLGVHLPLDVIGGLAVGAGVAAVFQILPSPLRRRLRID